MLSILSIFGLSLLAGLAAFVVPFKQKAVKLLLTFSGAFLISITVSHLLPEAFGGGKSVQVSVFILLGFFFQIILEYFSKGIEHGHLHNEECEHNHSLPYLMFFSLFVHSTIEGSVVEWDGKWQWLSLSIAIHKVPVAFALMALLRSVLKTKSLLFILLLLFALSSPFGSFLNHSLGDGLDGKLVNAFVGGMFLHISTTILFESSPHHKFDFLKFSTAIFGALLGLVPEFL